MRDALKALEDREDLGENNTKRTSDRISHDLEADDSDSPEIKRNSPDVKPPRKKNKTTSNTKGKKKQKHEDASDSEEDPSDKYALPYEKMTEEEQLEFESM